MTSIEQLAAQLDSAEKGQICDRCREFRPAEPLYWPPDEKTPTRFGTTCKQCLALEERQEESERILKQAKQLKINAANTVEQMLLASSSETKEMISASHVDELYEDLLFAFGGSKGFAATLQTEFFMAKPGSNARLTIAKMLLSLGIKVSEMGGSEIDKEMLSDDDLEKEIERRVELEVQRRLTTLKVVG